LEFSWLTSRHSSPMMTVVADAKMAGAAPRQARIMASRRLW